MDALIELRQAGCCLRRRYDRRPVLRGITLECHRGEFIGLVGPTGSGKTTLLSVLLGHWQGSVSGTVRVNTAAVGFVPTSPLLTTGLTVRETLAFSAVLRLPDTSDAEREARVEDALRAMGLDGREQLTRQTERSITRRVAVAGELLREDTKLLLLDEPTTGLNSHHAAELMSLLQGLTRDRGLTIVVSVHQPKASVFMMFSKAVLMAGGRVLFAGPPLEVAGHLAAALGGIEKPPVWSVAEFALEVAMAASADQQLPMEVELNAANKLIDFRTVHARARKLGVDGLAELFLATRHRGQLESETCEEEATGRDDDDAAAAADAAVVVPADLKRRPCVGWGLQCMAVVRRQLIHRWRDPVGLIVLVTLCTLQALLIAAVFWQLPDYVEGLRPIQILDLVQMTLPAFLTNGTLQPWVHNYDHPLFQLLDRGIDGRGDAFVQDILSPQPNAYWGKPIVNFALDTLDGLHKGWNVTAAWQYPPTEWNVAAVVVDDGEVRQRWAKQKSNGEWVQESFDQSWDRDSEEAMWQFTQLPWQSPGQKTMPGRDDSLMEDVADDKPLSGIARNAKIDVATVQNPGSVASLVANALQRNGKESGSGSPIEKAEWVAGLGRGMRALHTGDMLWNHYNWDNVTYCEGYAEADALIKYGSYWLCYAVQMQNLLYPAVSTVGFGDMRSILSLLGLLLGKSDWIDNGAPPPSLLLSANGSPVSRTSLIQASETANVMSPAWWWQRTWPRRKRQLSYEAPTVDEVIGWFWDMDPSSARQALSDGGWSELFDRHVGAEVLELLPVVQEYVSAVIERETECRDPLCNALRPFVDSLGDAARLLVQWLVDGYVSASSMFNVCGVVFFIALFVGFTAYDVVLVFPRDRKIFNREEGAGLYSCSAYYIGRQMGDFPFQLLPPVILAVILYFGVGLHRLGNSNFAQFAAYLGIALLTSSASYGFGYAVSSVSQTLEIAVLIAPVFLIAWLCVAGFFLRDADVSPWLGWLKYISFYRWAFFGQLSVIFADGKSFGSLSNEFSKALAGVTEDRVWFNCLMLLLVNLLYRTVGFFGLKYCFRSYGVES